MTTTMTHYQVNSITPTTCNFSDDLKEKITQQNKLTESDIIYIFNNDGISNTKNVLTGNKIVGNSNLNVLYKNPDNENNRYDKLENEMKEMKKQIDELNEKVNSLDTIIINELVEKIIRNTATNIILFFLGEEPNPNKPSHRFKNPENINKLDNIIKTNDLPYDAEKLGVKFDEIINRRNICIHPCSLDKLKNDVDNCRSYIDMYPKLTKKFMYEAIIIENYEKF
jgi:hypothetical protein